MQKRNRQRVNRYRFTINNPFITEDVNVLNIDTMTDEQRALFERTRNDYTHLKGQPFFDFAVCEYSQKEYGETFSKVVADRIFFKDYRAAQEYFKTIDFIDYVCFQYEQGALGTKHLQGFMHFNRQMDFSVVRDIFPTIHLDRCTEQNSYCIDYCKKKDTRIEGFPFFEWGIPPADERARTDMTEFMQDVLSGMSKIELFKKYPHLTLQTYNKIAQIQQDALYEKYQNVERELQVTYIYGKADAGKTTFPTRVLGFRPMDICKVADYGSGKFDEYNAHDIILFDEFHGQIPITKMNDYLQGQPLFLPARYANKVACYTRVFVISNYPLDEQYQKERAEGKQPSFEGFLRRITEIIYMPERNVYIWQKGQPTAETIAKLTEQGARYEIKEVQ